MTRTFLFASTAVAILASSAVARADFATPPGAVAVAGPTLAVAAPVRDVAEAKREDRAFMAIKLEGGPAYMPGAFLHGGYGRLVAEALFTQNPSGQGFVYGLWDAIEGWAGPNKAGGFAIPVLGEIGFRAGPVVGTVGAGVNLFTFDTIAEKHGGGGLSPRANARLALNIKSFYVAGTVDVQRRWQVGLPSMTMYQAGIAAGVMFDAGDKKR